MKMGRRERARPGDRLHLLKAEEGRSESATFESNAKLNKSVASAPSRVDLIYFPVPRSLPRYLSIFINTKAFPHFQ